MEQKLGGQHEQNEVCKLLSHKTVPLNGGGFSILEEEILGKENDGGEK